MRTRRELVTRGPFPWAMGTLLLLLAGVALYLFTGAASSEPSLAQAPSRTDITFGTASPELVVIEYSDFQCEFCAQYAPTLTQLREEYGDRVQFVFRFFPLNKHPYALIAAQAAYAAHLQGKFWEMHDLLFAEQQEWSNVADPRSMFEGYATQLGLDVARFRTDMDAAATGEFIRAELAEGSLAGVTHTPWFVIDDTAVTPRTIAQFRKLIEAGL